jgi:hypothetical protein
LAAVNGSYKSLAEAVETLMRAGLAIFYGVALNLIELDG